MRARQLTIFGAEFLLVTSICSIAVLAITGAGPLAIGLHATLAIMALTSTGFARLTDKADLKRQLTLAREQAKFATDQTTLNQKGNRDDQ